MQNKFFQFLGLTKKAGQLIEGYNKCEEAIMKGKIQLLILSKDCSKNTYDKFKRYAERYQVKVIEGVAKEQLGAVLGRTEINIVGVKESKMSEKLTHLWNEVE